MEPSQRSKGGLSGSTEIAGALTEIIKVLRLLRRNMVMRFREVVDAINKEYLVEELSEDDSELELEMTLDKLTKLAAESKEGEMYWEWLVETGRVRKTGEEGEEKVEEKRDEENVEKGREAEVAVWKGIQFPEGSSNQVVLSWQMR
jgi:hypothetical protein